MADEEQPPAFDTRKYIAAQGKDIRDRLAKFTGRLYLEVGGKLLNDGHASRVLPGFEPGCKVDLLLSQETHQGPLEFLLCINARDIIKGRVWKEGETYEETLVATLRSYTDKGLPKPTIVFNLVDQESKAAMEELRKSLKDKGYESYFRYAIKGYPDNLDAVVHENGFGQDDHIPVQGDLVVVTGIGSSCGKLSTCLGQIYLDRVRDQLDSGYSKYELFPIWDLPKDHPINLAYEAATADIGDYNVDDPYHKEAYGITAVNYNRDVDAFPLLQKLLTKVASPSNHSRTYKSPTDMGVNNASQGIDNEPSCIEAAVKEIESRIERYKKEVGEDSEPVRKCRKLLAAAVGYDHDEK